MYDACHIGTSASEDLHYCAAPLNELCLSLDITGFLLHIFLLFVCGCAYRPSRTASKTTTSSAKSRLAKKRSKSTRSICRCKPRSLSRSLSRSRSRSDTARSRPSKTRSAASRNATYGGEGVKVSDKRGKKTTKRRMNCYAAYIKIQLANKKLNKVKQAQQSAITMGVATGWAEWAMATQKFD